MRRRGQATHDVVDQLANGRLERLPLDPRVDVPGTSLEVGHGGERLLKEETHADQNRQLGKMRERAVQQPGEALYHRPELGRRELVEDDARLRADAGQERHGAPVSAEEPEEGEHHRLDDGAQIRRRGPRARVDGGEGGEALVRDRLHAARDERADEVVLRAEVVVCGGNVPRAGRGVHRPERDRVHAVRGEELLGRVEQPLARALAIGTGPLGCHAPPDRRAR